MLNIKETIVVEGKGDASNLARVCEANYIITSGLHISKKTYNEIELAINTTGIIIFTDPDSAGETIRRKISDKFIDKADKIKHAHISAREGRKNGDLGVENASEETLTKALSNLYSNSVPSSGLCHPERSEQRERSRMDLNKDFSTTASAYGRNDTAYTIQDMYALELAGSPYASENRRKLCEELNIGYSNAKVLCKKLNSYQIPMNLIEKVTSR